MYRKFASLSSQDHAYAYDSGAYDMRAPLEQHFRMFQTYGDGLVQHSGDWSIQIDHLADYLASLAQAAMDDEELLDRIKHEICNRPREEDIAFAFSVIHNPERPRYVNMKENKMSGSTNKEYDKRWQKIEDWANGSAFAAYRLLIPDWADGMMKYSYAEAVRDWCHAGNDRPPCEQAAVMLKWFENNKDQRESARLLYNAYQSCYLLSTAYLTRHAGKTALENYKRALNIPIEEKSSV